MQETNVGRILLQECINSYIKLLQMYSRDLSTPNADLEALTRQTKAAVARINSLFERCSVDAEYESIGRRYPINFY